MCIDKITIQDFPDYSGLWIVFDSIGKIVWIYAKLNANIQSDLNYELDIFKVNLNGWICI